MRMKWIHSIGSWAVQSFQSQPPHLRSNMQAAVGPQMAFVEQTSQLEREREKEHVVSHRGR